MSVARPESLPCSLSPPSSPPAAAGGDDDDSPSLPPRVTVACAVDTTVELAWEERRLESPLPCEGANVVGTGPTPEADAKTSEKVAGPFEDPNCRCSVKE